MGLLGVGGESGNNEQTFGKFVHQTAVVRSEAPSVASLGRRSVVSAQSGVDHRGTTTRTTGWVMGTVLENTGGIRRKYGLKITHDFFWVDFLNQRC